LNKCTQHGETSMTVIERIILIIFLYLLPTTAYALYAFKSRGFGGQVRLVIANTRLAP